MVTESKQATPWRYLLLEMILILLASYLLLFASTKANQLNPIVLLLNSILLTLIAVFLIFKSRTNIGVEIPLAVMLAVMLLASLTSIDSRRSLGEFGLVAIPICLFFAISEWVNRYLPKELVIKALLVVGGIFMVLSWAEAAQWYLAWIKANPGMWLPDSNFRLMNPNIIAMLVNVWLMLALGRLLASRKSGGRIVLAVWILSGLGIIYLTSSRGGWLGTAAGLLTLGIIYLRTKRDRWQPVWEKLKKSRVFIIGSLTAILIVSLVGGFLLYRQATHPSHGTRTEFWTPAWQAFTEAPILGKGPFTFVSAYLQANSVPTMVPVDYAHSLYMDLLSGTGVLGLLAFIWLIYMVIRVTWKRICEDAVQDWAVSAGALAALITFLVHGFVDSVHHSEPISLWNICIVFGTALTVTSRTEKRSNWQYGFKVGLTLAAAGLTWFSWWTLLPMKAGVEKANQGDWQGASVLFDEAIKRDSKMAATYQQTGLTESMLAVTGRQGSLDQAISNYEATVQIDPYWGLNQANLAALYRSAGRLDEARAGFEKAVKLAPRSEIFQLNLGVVQEELGDFENAEKTYHTVFAINPDWVETGFWRTNSFRQKVLQSWQASQPVKQVMDIQSMEAAVKAQPDASLPYIPLARAYLDKGMILEAEKTLARSEFSLGSNNQRIELAWLKVEIYAEKNDYSKAIESGRGIINAYMDYGVFGPATHGNELYDAYMFRRPAVRVDFVPQMQVILLPDKWGYRIQNLADWLEAAGNVTEAKTWRELVSRNIPDLPTR